MNFVCITLNHMMSHLKYIFILFNYVCSVNILSCSKITQIHLVFRHGERSPSEIYPSDPHNESVWVNGLGSLTKEGKLQIFELGNRIKMKYKDVIPEYYYPKDVSMLSSYSDRCLMSAQLLTSSLFVPKNEQIWNKNLLWQPIPAAYKPRNQDNMIAAKQNCTKYDKQYVELFNTPKYKKILDENQELFKYLTENTRTNISTLRKLEELYNTLEIEELHKLELPNWTKKVFPKSMEPLASLSLASITETNYMKRMKGGTFLNKMIGDMHKMLDGKDVEKLFLYSGHDVTLVNILRTLNLVDKIKPGFAAYLTFELRNSSEIKIFYSNCGWCLEKELYIKNCDIPCTLNKFKEIINPVLPKNWEDECKVVEEK